MYIIYRWLPRIEHHNIHRLQSRTLDMLLTTIAATIYLTSAQANLKPCLISHLLSVLACSMETAMNVSSSPSYLTSSGHMIITWRQALLFFNFTSFLCRSHKILSWSAIKRNSWNVGTRKFCRGNDLLSRSLTEGVVPTTKLTRYHAIAVTFPRE